MDIDIDIGIKGAKSIPLNAPPACPQGSRDYWMHVNGSEEWSISNRSDTIDALQWFETDRLKINRDACKLKIKFKRNRASLVCFVYSLRQ